MVGCLILKRVDERQENRAEKKERKRSGGSWLGQRTMVDHAATAIAIISIRRVGTLMVVARLMCPASVPVSSPATALDVLPRAPPGFDVHS
ncbi:hypothetical protein QLX08_006984 [Tetragonisca angustula]|uniref:Uncharacterized protein n=1 Tax=Tetragonisca angustula TaxID=166442 RepID=A0AAW0ZRF9_9HYME